MTKITLSIDNIKDLQIIKDIARRLKIEILEEKEFESSSRERKQMKCLNKIAEEGNLKKQIEDPVEWQREQRKDKVLLDSE